MDCQTATRRTCAPLRTLAPHRWLAVLGALQGAPLRRRAASPSCSLARHPSRYRHCSRRLQLHGVESDGFPGSSGELKGAVHACTAAPTCTPSAAFDRCCSSAAQVGVCVQKSQLQRQLRVRGELHHIMGHFARLEASSPSWVDGDARTSGRWWLHLCLTGGHHRLFTTF